MRLKHVFTAFALWPTVSSATDLPRPDVPNPHICDVYVDCRPLTDGEIALSRAYFGETIPYEKVSIVNGRYLGVFPIGNRHWAIAPDGNIYVAAPHMASDDYSQDPVKVPFFMHEMAHVWQHAKGVNVITSAMRLHVGTSENPYLYDLEIQTNFENLSIEQQASILQKHVFLGQMILASGMDAIDIPYQCETLGQHRAMLVQAMNVPPIPDACL